MVSDNGKIVIMGVGSAGIQAVNYIKDYIDIKADFILIDTHITDFKKILDPYTFARGISSDVYNDEYNKPEPFFYIYAKDMPTVKPLISDILSNANKVFVVCWVGWGTSDTPGLANYITKTAKSAGAEVNVVALLPLEDKENLRNSIKTSRKIAALKSRSNNLVMLDSNEILPYVKADIQEEEAFSYLRPQIIEQIKAKINHF